MYIIVHLNTISEQMYGCTGVAVCAGNLNKHLLSFSFCSECHPAALGKS